MNVAIILGLLAALLFGTTDFAARFAVRRTGTLRTIFYGDLAAACIMSGIVMWRGVPSADLTTWLITIASNLSGLAASACLLRAMATGSLGIVSPIAATYGGVTALLAAASGEALHLAGWIGVALTTAGGATVAKPHQGPKVGPVDHTGAIFAAAAAILYGTSFWLLGQFVVPMLGAVVPTCSYYVLGTAASLAFGISVDHQLRLPSAPALSLVLGTAILGCGATLVLAYGEITGHVAVVTALSTLASVVTVFLARLLLKEKVSISGWIGVTLIVVGLTLLHSG
ncbi:DMT family transporter [Acidisoma silvae]|uniref:DMT family transporter n=1 Tax=Acidisoma silvae TaxID=2802396 RepID=A0A964E0U6_9PROT|nr:DMT family transporter [Acidisoma silvae]MCB8877905.1 DMT family transporter [Acidisoma silvae]